MKTFDWDEDNFLPYVVIALAFIGIVLGIAFAVAIVIQTMDVITCLTFPEKIIFETVQHMMK